MTSSFPFFAKKQRVLESIARQFDHNRHYAEGEVDEVIRFVLPSMTDVDPQDGRFEVTHLRRGLVSAGLLTRERDGSRYQLAP